MRSHSGFRHGLGTEPWPLVTCLNVFRAVSKALLNPYRETFSDDAVFDATVDAVSTTRRKVNSQSTDRGTIPNARMQRIVRIDPRSDSEQSRLRRIHEA